MKPSAILTVTTLLSALLFSLHWADEIARGIEPGGLASVGGILILVVWTYAALGLAGRPVGLVLLLLASVLGAGVPILHMKGAGLVSPRIAGTGRVLFWVWTLIGLGVLSTISFLFSAGGLWSRWRGRTGPKV